jgi:hypothetical protein
MLPAIKEDDRPYGAFENVPLLSCNVCELFRIGHCGHENSEWLRGTLLTLSESAHSSFRIAANEQLITTNSLQGNNLTPTKILNRGLNDAATRSDFMEVGTTQ